MNAEFHHISPERALEFFEPEDREAILNHLRLSDPLLECKFDGKTGCLLGFIPPTILADKAFVWIQDFPYMAEHPLVVGLAARRLLKEALKRYPMLYGRCTKYSVPWLRSLGAKINFPDWVIEA